MVKPPKLTMAQVYTLRRIMSGTSYSLRGDGKKAHENRPDIGVSRGEWFRTTTPVNAPSIPVLYRLGLINFANPRAAAKQPNHWHQTVVTGAGAVAYQQTKERTE